MSNEDTLLEFPCDFEVKAMGPAADDFEKHVTRIVRRHVPEEREISSSTKMSKAGSYHSVTISFVADSKAQLNAIYQSLTEDGRVLMSL